MKEAETAAQNLRNERELLRQASFQSNLSNFQSIVFDHSTMFQKIRCYKYYIFRNELPFANYKLLNRNLRFRLISMQLVIR